MYCQIENGRVIGVSRRQSDQYNEFREGVSAPEADPVHLAKTLRDSALTNLSFNTSLGVDIQCREQDEQRIRTAIDLMARNSLTEYPWYAADNSVTTVTIADLENAIISGQEQGATIWAEFFASI